MTDSGPKILPIPVVTHQAVNGSSWAPYEQFSLGFAYAGDTLSAVSTHALASACTQNLACNKPGIPPPSVECIAELFRKVGEHYLTDTSTRLGGEDCSFAAHVFGFCRTTNRYRAFVIYPESQAGQFSMKAGELDLTEGMVYPFGSGKETLIAIDQELIRAGKTSGMIPALREMLRRDTTPSVGGYFQCGIGSRSGFDLCPILNIGGPQDRHVTFLGFSVSEVGDLEGHNIGYHAFSPDVG